MSLGFQFAPIDISIVDHDKVLEIDRRVRHAAFGLWCWGQCYAKKHSKTGRLRRSAVLASLAGDVGLTTKLAAELVRVGLWLAADDGWDIYNFEKKSGSSSAERVRRFREKQRQSEGGVTAASVTSPVTVTPCNEGVVTAPSISPSISVSVSSGESPERGPPGWFAEVVTAVCDDTGERFAVHEAWIRYSGHRTTVGKAINAQDARYWLGTVMVPEARKERRAESDRKANRDRFKDHTPKHEPPTPGQTSAFQAELQRRLAAEAKKGAA